MMLRPPISTLFPTRRSSDLYVTIDPNFSVMKQNDLLAQVEPQPFSVASSFKCFIAIKYTNVIDRKSTRLNSSHSQISYAVFCLKKKSDHRRVGGQRAITEL